MEEEEEEEEEEESVMTCRQISFVICTITWWIGPSGPSI
jgi:hypothetical protein